MKYYTERNALLSNEFCIDFDEIKEYFYQTYEFFVNKKYFDCAENGIWIKEAYSDKKNQILPPTLEPSPEIFFINHLHDSQIYPICENYEEYIEEILFTVIEILYDHIADYNYQTRELIKEEPRKEFQEHINSILKFYKDGYYLEPTQGFILSVPNEPIKKLLEVDVTELFEDETLEQFRTAVRLYYRFDTDSEMKKNAIKTLAGILEPIRKKLKDVLNKEYGINKNNHDKLIFDIVNNFDIRHNNGSQWKNYDKVIWHDWMMHYYTSVIIAYYKLMKTKEDA